MSGTKTVKSIVAEHLEEAGYDGLADDKGQCYCVAGSLFPCDIGYKVHECQPGYKAPCDCGENCGFHIIADG